jgi:membrane peptidoglycan carboxypeptidase
MTVVPLSEISPFIQKGTIAIEDSNFYNNKGIEPLSIIRAIIADITTGEYSQGASTITQQVVKNSLLTKDKTVTRKIKEWVLAIKLTRIISKDKILETYLNETPYGGTLYGVEEASQAFFGKPAKDLTLAQSAYLSAIPQAPTYYSPYGTHREALDSRQKLVLKRMKELELINANEYDTAINEKVKFLSKDSSGIRAPHFVMFVREYLVQKYGEDSVTGGGLRVITSLDYDMQQKAEEVIKKFSPTLASNFNASNTAMVAIDPKTGDILTMVGSKDYFDKTIDGNFNVALAQRQPGSTFKPFVYATLFKKGYTPETILFDTQTEFSQYCNPDGTPKDPSASAIEVDQKKKCYSPGEYDNIFEGPLSVRKALAQSRNIPAVKALYLAGIPESIQTAHDLGITSLNDPSRYGLTLVLGGGEVSLLDITSAYGVFANDGMRNPYRAILEVTDNKNVVLEKASDPKPVQVLDPQIARQISSIISDTSVRMSSLKPIGESIGRPVAIKTGTTNDYHDVWTLGYTPNLVVGAWAGNNDNIAMTHNVAGLIITPLWGAFMSQVVKNYPLENFVAPPPPLTDGKPILRGVWQGGESYKIDTVSGKLATQYTPQETTKEIVSNGVHTILNWVNKDDPRGPVPLDPKKDNQYDYWEYGVRKWFDTYKLSHPEINENGSFVVPTATDDVHTPDKAPKVAITSPVTNTTANPNNLLTVQLQYLGAYQAKKVDVYLNGKYVLSNDRSPLNFSFVPADVGTIPGTNVLSVILYDSVYNKVQAQVNLNFQ